MAKYTYSASLPLSSEPLPALAGNCAPLIKEFITSIRHHHPEVRHMQVSLQMTMFVIGTFASEGGCAGFCAVRRVDAGGVPFLLLTTWSFLIFWYSRRYFSCLLHNDYKSTLPTRSAHAVFCLMCNRRPMSLCDVPNKDISISISSSGCNFIGS